MGLIVQRLKGRRSGFNRLPSTIVAERIKNSHFGFSPEGGPCRAGNRSAFPSTDDIYILLRDAKFCIPSHFYYIHNRLSQRIPGFVESMKVPGDLASFCVSAFGADRYAEFLRAVEESVRNGGNFHFLFYEDAFDLSFIWKLGEVLRLREAIEFEDAAWVYLSSLRKVNRSNTRYPDQPRVNESIDSILRRKSPLTQYNNRYLNQQSLLPGKQFYSEVFSTSYSHPGMADLLSSVVRSVRAKTVLEIGAQQGKSAIALGRGLDPDGTVYSYDLFEQKYRIPPHGNTHSDQDVVISNFEQARKVLDVCGNLVSRVGSYPHALADLADEEIDVLHVDICNHLDSLKPVLDSLLPVTKYAVLLEGGRENSWQKENGFKSFAPLLETPEIERDWESFVIPFTNNNAITVMLRRGLGESLGYGPLGSIV